MAERPIQEETRKNVFRGETGPLPSHFGTIFFNQPENPNIWSCNGNLSPTRRKMPQIAAKRRKTPQNTAKHHKTLQNTAKHRKTPQNAANALVVIANLPQNTRKRRKMPQNAAKRCKTLQNAAKRRKTPPILRIGDKSFLDQIFGGGGGVKNPAPILGLLKLIVDHI